jgi:CHAT domain-containing protein
MSAEIVNRLQQLQQIREALAGLVGGKFELRYVALEYYGVEGIGKTIMLEQAKKEVLNQKLPLVVVDFRYGWSLLDEDVSSAILRFLGQICDQLDGRFSISPVRAVLSELPSQPKSNGNGEFLSRYLGLLNGALGGTPLVLTLDSMEFCPVNLLNWLGKEFISRYVQIEGSAGVGVFMAGRGPRVADSGWPRLFKRATQSYRLSPLDFDHTAEHIGRLWPEGQYQSAAPFIYTLSNGHPYSTEVIVHELGQLGVAGEKASTKRHVLAEKLYEAVFHRHILGDAPEWVQKFIEVASIPRHFTPGLIQQLFRSLPQLPTEINPDVIEYQWFHYRLADLQEPPWQLVYIRQDAYEVEPTLRKLLHTALSILRPDETIRLHERVRDFLIQEKELTVSQALEAVYHRAAVAGINHVEHPVAVVEKELDQLLVRYDREQPRHIQELLQLVDLLKKDDELNDLLDKTGVDALIRKIQVWLNPPELTYQSTHIVIEHFPPSEYRVGWYQADQVILPVETVSSSLRFKPQRWKEQTLEAGRAAFSAYLPARAQDFIRERRDLSIQLSTNHSNIPWELLHDGDEFLCLSRPFARKAQTLREPRRKKPAQRDKRALVIGNPTNDLPGAEVEAKAVAKTLEKGGWDVDLFVAPLASAEEITIKVNSVKYALFHFAGHAYFDPAAPNKSGLMFPDGVLYAEEVERWQYSPSFLFLSACESGEVATEHTLRGEYMEGFASSALLGWVDECLGPVWPIGDTSAKEFALAFYEHLLNGKPFGEAVRQARLAVQGMTSCDWASWVLYGDPLRKLNDLVAGSKKDGNHGK